jgi:hypothetical protein
MPLVPIFPLISVFVNFYLIMVLPVATWIRFGVWLAIGFLIYFSYGIRNSSENSNFKRKQANRVHVNTSNNQYNHFPNQNQFS